MISKLIGGPFDERIMSIEKGREIITLCKEKGNRPVLTEKPMDTGRMEIVKETYYNTNDTDDMYPWRVIFLHESLMMRLARNE